MKLPRTLVQGGIYTTSKIISKIFSFFALIYFARVVGAENFGVYTYLISLIYLVLPFSTLGMFGEIIRKAKSRCVKAFSETFFLIFLLNLISGGIVFGIVMLRGYSWILASLSFILFILINSFTFLKNAHLVWGRVKFVSLSTITERFIFSLLVIFLPKKTVFLFISMILSYFFVNLYLFKIIKLKPTKKISFKYFSLPFFLVSIFSAFSSRLPNLIYDFRFGVATLGNFGAALLIFQGIGYIINDLGGFISLRGGLFTEKQFKVLKRLSIIFAAGLLLLSIIMSPLTILFGDLIFGSKFSNIGNLLFIMTLASAGPILYYYPQTKLIYHSPWKYALMSFSYILFSVVFAFLAKDIVQATILKVVATYIQAVVGWILSERTIIKT